MPGSPVEPLIAKPFDGVPVQSTTSSAYFCNACCHILCWKKSADEVFTSGGSESTARRPSSAASVRSIDQALYDMGYTDERESFEDDDSGILTFATIVPASPAVTVIHRPIAHASPPQTGNAKEDPPILTL